MMAMSGLNDAADFSRANSIPANASAVTRCITFRIWAMNKYGSFPFFNFSFLRRMILNMWTRCSISLATLAVALCAAGCGRRDAVQVHLSSRSPSDQGAMHLEIAAEVAGTQSGLHYKWFSLVGGCNPQESDKPTTLFKFADGANRDRVSVEVWRDGKIVGRSQLYVKLDEVQARLRELPADAHVKIT